MCEWDSHEHRLATAEFLVQQGAGVIARDNVCIDRLWELPPVCLINGACNFAIALALHWQRGNTALMLAVSHRLWPKVAFLVQQGADLNIQNEVRTHRSDSDAYVRTE